MRFCGFSLDGNGKQNPAIYLVLLSCKSDRRKLLAGFTKLFIAGFFCSGQLELLQKKLSK